MNHRVFSGLLACCILTGCVIENDPAPSRSTGGTPVAPAPGASAGSGSGGSTSTGSGGTGSSGTGGSTVSPMLVDVDTDQTMSATPGDGVGVFIEYKTGGGWHVWWTCDTNTSNQTCNFNVKVSATSPITNLATQGTAQVSTQNPAVLSFQTVTGASIDGVTFSTNPGDVITLDATVDGAPNGSFVFFVQDGKVNGGYTGKLTNPLKLEGNKP
jgi:hypothetical protein